jgi:diguanylate cyclase (GGDEF)-like protein
MFLFLRRRINELAALAATDELTQIFNNREFTRRLDQEVSRSKRQESQFCFVLIDIDSLKQANDTYGYSAGDNLLKEFARLAKSKVRLPDVLARYRQGDEFAILALDTDAVGARTVTERLRGQIENYHFSADKAGLRFKITFSAGIAEFDCASDSAETLQKHAEIALTSAKRTKNAVATYVVPDSDAHGYDS